MIEVAFIKSPLGEIKLVSAFNKIVEIRFVESTSLANEIKEYKSIALNTAIKEIKAYFESGSTDFTFLYDLNATEFQKKVWGQLLKIPKGTTISYEDLAITLGDIKCIRAAASANSKNPIAIVVPCHRVIGKKGDLTGYAGGVHRKEWLLKHEGALKTNQLKLF